MLTNKPDPRRLAPGHPLYDQILRAHDAACRRGEDTYADPVSGNLVFTHPFLLARGFCCEGGCRHCPFVGQSPA